MLLHRFLCLSLLPLAGLGQSYDPEILRSIKQQALASHSDAVIIVQNGSVLYQDFFGQKEKPVYIASAGKSLTSLAIGKLLDEGLLDSLDQPVHTLYPQWKQGQKRDITIRMLLNHTSGLQNHPNASIELEPAPDYQVQNVTDLALAAELSDRPGENVAYNNKAVALLGGIVEKASGKRFDRYFEASFFEPMEITDYDWIRDKDGNPTVHGAFVLKPSDLLKFGVLVLNNGRYQGQRILSEDWIRTSLQPGQEEQPIWGLLWWRLPEFEKRIIDEATWETWEAAGVAPSFLQKMEPLRGKLYETKYAFYADLESVLGKEWSRILNQELPRSVQSSRRIYSDEIKAYYADGYRGNYLVVVPEHQIIAVRCADAEGFDYKTDFFRDFVPLVSQLGN